MDIYIAVGFHVHRTRSLFYIRDENRQRFYEKLWRKEAEKKPDFISIRIAQIGKPASDREPELKQKEMLT